MLVDLSRLVNKDDVVAIALSGGSDSMALLHYMLSVREKFGFNVIAINVEHGIRGESSLSDTAFVQTYCEKNSIPLLTYSVDSLKKATDEHLSVEEAARLLRYECFYSAIMCGKCTKVATAHHQKDNAESVLINLLRGTGIKGVTGITANFENKIIRPFIDLSKEEIQKYIADNAIPFVTDESNFNTDYTRNFIRANVLPEIKKVFPEAEKSITRFAKIASLENEFLDDCTKKAITAQNNAVKITLPLHPALLSRAAVYALKACGVKKDWEKAHIDGVINLAALNNGAKLCLPKNVVAIKEYDCIAFYIDDKIQAEAALSFSVGEHKFIDKTLIIKRVDKENIDLKSGLFADLDKIPSTAQIRTKQDGDSFTKFGGGSKKLNDFLTDKKIPLRLRDTLPIIADENTVYAIFGVATSDNCKVTESTKNIVQFIND